MRVAGSLTLSLLNSFAVAIALATAYSGISPWWGAVALWTVPVPLVPITTAYVIADAVRSGTRKQALIAAALLVPTTAVEWCLRFRGI